MRTFLRFTLPGLLGIVCMCAAVGCGRVAAEPDFAPPVEVTGVVTLDGKPIEGAMVNFTPNGGQNMGHGAMGVTDGAGKYVLSRVVTQKPLPGAPPGDYRVWISRLVGPDGKFIVPKADVPPADLGAAESLPVRYSDMMRTELQVKVSLSGGAFDFDLTSQ